MVRSIILVPTWGLLCNLVAASNYLSKTSPTTTADSTQCNPLSTSCSADNALATSFLENFEEEGSYFDEYSSSGEVTYGSDGLEMTLTKRFDNPGLKSNFYIMFGKIEAIVKAANGTGIVSCVYLQSDDLDEIDLEWLGGDTTQFQTNFFSQGNTTTYDRGEYHSVDQPQSTFHNYTIDWGKDETVFYLDGEEVRTISSDNDSGYPQTPMYIMMGVWAGGDSSNAEGTIEWAGGLTDYSEAPFSMYVEEVVVTDYSSGTAYVYTNTNGTWESIEAENGKVYGRYQDAVEEFAILVDGGELESVAFSTSSSTSSSSTSSSSISSSSTSSSSTSSSSTSSSSTSSSSASSSSTSSSSTSSSSISSSSTSSSSTPSSSNQNTEISSQHQETPAISTSTTTPVSTISLSSSIFSSTSSTSLSETTENNAYRHWPSFMTLLSVIALL